MAIYALAVEPNTPFSAQGLTVNDDHQADQYQLIQQVMLENGYEHYEVSNFCKPGRMAVHNAKYLPEGHNCQPLDYIGAPLVPIAFLMGDAMTLNIPDIEGYLNQLPAAFAKGTTNEWTDYIFIKRYSFSLWHPLRLREPLVFEHVQQQF